MKRLILSGCFVTSALFVQVASATTVVFDAAGNIVGSVAGSWGGAATSVNSGATRAGASFAESITNNLVRRGFLPTDPRVVSTVEAVSARVASSAGSLGAGVSWFATASRFGVYGLTAFSIYQGIKWLFDNNSNVITQTGGDVGQLGGPIAVGQSLYFAESGCAGGHPTLEDVYLEYAKCSLGAATVVQMFIDQVPGITDRWTENAYFTYPGSDSLRSQYYGIYVSKMPSPIACPAGSHVLANTCVANQHTASTYQPRPTSTPAQPITDAYNQLPQAAKDAPISPELLSDLINRAYRDAAANPPQNSTLIPWSASAPVSTDDVKKWQTDNPSFYPTPNDFAQPVPTSKPVQNYYVNNNQISNTSNNTSTTTTNTSSVDLGPDPGTPIPNLEAPPDDLFKPIRDLLKPWIDWQVPTHSALCPTWDAHPSIGGHVFDIELNYHCELAEQYRSAITISAMACWVIIAAFIVLSA